uniref:Uncharacterized protein n=1 Tax=Oryza punctata TaxID=4537 RepID=A0A0E0KU81_ORYPU
MAAGAAPAPRRAVLCCQKEVIGSAAHSRRGRMIMSPDPTWRFPRRTLRSRPRRASSVSCKFIHALPLHTDVHILTQESIAAAARPYRRPQIQYHRPLTSCTYISAPLVGDGKMHMDVEDAPLVGNGKMHIDVEEEMATALAVHQPSSQSQRVTEIEMMADVGSPSSPGSPYSPSSPSFPRDTPSCDIYGSDTEEDSSCEEDPYFNSLVDDFIGAATNTGLLTSSPEIDYLAANESQSLFYAESASKHYNNNDENKIKYELISAITSNAIIDRSDYGHVNFVAKGDNRIRWMSGYRDIEVDYPRGGFAGVPVNKKHCYACGDGLKHPEDGTLYESGHIASGSYYD